MSTLIVQTEQEHPEIHMMFIRILFHPEPYKFNKNYFNHDFNYFISNNKNVLKTLDLIHCFLALE